MENEKMLNWKYYFYPLSKKYNEIYYKNLEHCKNKNYKPITNFNKKLIKHMVYKVHATDILFNLLQDIYNCEKLDQIPAYSKLGKELQEIKYEKQQKIRIYLIKNKKDEIEFREILNILLKHFNKVYIVGGYLRDIISNRNPSDTDFVINCDYYTIKKIFQSYSWKVSINGKNYSVLNVSKNHKHFEISSLVDNDIIKDSERRDFVNSVLYYNINTNILIDPTGKAINDCCNNIIRFNGNFHDRVKEDPLRILRFYRFVSHGWKPDKKSLKNVRTYFSEIIDRINKARMLEEIEKMCNVKEVI